jgi:hypothetical protein
VCVIKRKDAGRYERITGVNGPGKQRQIRGRHCPGVVLRWWLSAIGVILVKSLSRRRPLKLAGRRDQ